MSLCGLRTLDARPHQLNGNDDRRLTTTQESARYEKKIQVFERAAGGPITDSPHPQLSPAGCTSCRRGQGQVPHEGLRALTACKRYVKS